MCEYIIQGHLISNQPYNEVLEAAQFMGFELTIEVLSESPALNILESHPKNGNRLKTCQMSPCNVYTWLFVQSREKFSYEKDRQADKCNF